MRKRDVHGRRRRRGRSTRQRVFRARARIAAGIAITAVATAAIAAWPVVAPAASFVWDGGGGNDDWSTNNNWSPNGAPSTANTTDTITFAGTSGLTPNLNANRTIASLTFASGAGAFTLGSSTGSTLTIGSGGITNNDADTQTITHALALGAAHTWNAAAGAIVTSGTVNLAASTLTIDGGFATTLAGVVTGTGGITKNGAATLTISGGSANTYSGTTTVNAGTLNLGKTAGVNAITGNLTIGDGSGTDTVSLLAANQIGGAGTITINSSGVLALNTFADQVNNVVLNGGQITTSGAAGSLQLGGQLSTTASANTATLSGPGSLVLFTNNKTFTVDDGAAAIDLDIASTIVQDVSARSITKAGAGALRLSGGNSFSGGISLTAGTLILASNTAAGTGAITLAGGTLVGAGNLTLSNAVNVTAATTVAGTGGFNIFALHGVVSGSGAITVDNDAFLRLGGASANTYTGTITVLNGSLDFAKPNGVNATAGNLVIGDHSTAATIAWVGQLANEQLANTAIVTVRRSGIYDLFEGNHSETIGALVLEDGRVSTGTGTLTVAGPITSSNVTPGEVSTIAGNLSLGGATRNVTVGANSTLQIDAVVSNGGINYSGAGTLALNANNTFAGGVTHGGTAAVAVAANGSFGTGTVTTAAGATRNFTVDGSAKTLANAFVLNAATQFALAADLTLIGNISGAGAITKDGVGNLTLGGSGSTYTGATNITGGGKLIITANNALGATSAGTTIGPAGGVEGVGLELVNVNYTAPEPLTLNSHGVTDTVASTSGSSTWTGPITLLNHARFDASGGTLTIAGPIAAGNFNVYLDGAFDSTYAGAITGTGLMSLLKQGSGVASLTAGNNLTAVQVNQGTLRLAAPGTNTLPDAAGVSVGSGATLSFATDDTIGTLSGAGVVAIEPGVTAGVTAGSFAGAITGGGTNLVKIGGATTLTYFGTAANTFTGATRVLEGGLYLNKSTANRAINGPLEIGADAASPAAAVDLLADEQIADTATVTVRRSGLFNVAGRAETIGGLTLVDGTVVTGVGTLTVAGPITSSNTSPGAVSTASGNLNLGGGTRTITSAAGNTLNVDAVIANGGVSLQGDGVANFNAANTFAGGFEHASGSTVTINSNTALGTGTITTAAGATRAFAGPTGPRTLANNFVLNAPTTFTSNFGLTLSGTISGSAGITSSGSLRLSGAGNSYAGVTTVTSGSLWAMSDGALGATAAGTVVSPGATLSILGTYLAPEPVTISGNGLDNVGALTVGTSNTTFAGPITLAADAKVRAAFNAARFTGAINTGGFLLTLEGFNPGGGGTPPTFAGPITGAAGPGILIRDSVIFDAANNTYAGPTDVAGTLITAGGTAVDSIPNSSAVTVRDGGILRLGAGDVEGIGSLAGVSLLAVPKVELTADAELITGGNGASTTFEGIISDPSFVTGGRLTKVGAGAFTLSGANTYRGVTTVAEGALRAAGGAAISDLASVNILVGATLEVAGDETIAGLSGNHLSGAARVTIGTGNTLTVTGGGSFTGIISGAGNLAKGGGAALFLSGPNNYTGRTTITGGTIDIVADSGLGAAPGAVVDNQLTLDSGGTLRVGDPNGSPLANVAIPANRGITIGADGGRLQAGNGDTLAVASRSSGGGLLTIQGVGGTSPNLPVITLSATNTTFTGKTSVDAAILSVASDANLSAAPASLVPDKLTLANGGTLRATATMTLPANRGVTLLNAGAGGAFDVNSAQTLTTLGPISGAGTLIKRGGGTLNLGGATAHGYTGKTIIDAGVVIAQQDTNFGAAPASLVADQLTINQAQLRWNASGTGIAATRGVRLGTSNSTINVDANVTMNVNSPLSGPGGLQKIGSGTLNLSGANSYAGATSVGAGRMILNQSFSTNTSFAVSAGAVVELAEAPAVTLRTTSVIASGRIDLKDNKLIITGQPIGTWNGAAYTGVTGMIASAYQFGAWSGSGILTSMPTASEQGITTLAVATAGDVFLEQFGGMSVAPGNVLVMYTYAGDLNFDGLIDGADYGVIDNYVQFPGTTGYMNGDFNYDGAIDGADYGIIDNAIQLQGNPFPVQSASASAAPAALSGVTAVPEPSAVACGFALSLGLLGRRRRRRR